MGCNSPQISNVVAPWGRKRRKPLQNILHLHLIDALRYFTLLSADINMLKRREPRLWFERVYSRYHPGHRSFALHERVHIRVFPFCILQWLPRAPSIAANSSEPLPLRLLHGFISLSPCHYCPGPVCFRPQFRPLTLSAPFFPSPAASK